MAPNVEFEEDKYGLNISGNVGRAGEPMRVAGNGERGMVRWLMKHGLAKSPKSASIILSMVIIVNAIIIFIVIRLIS